MLRCVFIIVLCFLAVQGVELFKNPGFDNGGKGWENWGKKNGLHVETAEGGGVRLWSDAPGLHQGLAQSIALTPGRKYRYSCTFSAKLAPGAKLSVLSLYSAASKWNKTYRSLAGSQEEDTHTMEFSVPSTLQGNVLLRPLILFGVCDVHLKQASLEEIGEGVEEKKQKVGKMPVIVPVVHPKMTIDLSWEEPRNARAHIAEKPSPLPEGASVARKDGAFVVNYNFTTEKHDAVMFDIVKELPSAAKVSMEIECSQPGHRLFFVLVDANGESHLVLKPLELNFQKKKLTYVLELVKKVPYNIYDSVWGGDKNQHLDLPLRSITIGIDDVPDTATGKGTVTIRNLKIGNW